jgi:hypothetical protein
MIVPDLSWFHVFLVPDEGFGAIVRPPVGSLAGGLHPEMPYIPHLTVASVKRTRRRSPNEGLA